jgi:uncharacterized membrane protein
MNLAHVHLLLNHFPILGSIFLTVLFIVALIYKNVFLQKVILWFLVAIALITAVTYLTGDPTVRAVQGLPGVSKDMIRQHELFAKFGLGLMFVTGIIALGGALFYSYKPRLPRAFLSIILIILLINSVLFSYIGFLGGQILHQEIRTSASTSPHLVLKR